MAINRKQLIKEAIAAIEKATGKKVRLQENVNGVPYTAEQLAQLLGTNDGWDMDGEGCTSREFEFDMLLHEPDGYVVFITGHAKVNSWGTDGERNYNGHPDSWYDDPGEFPDIDFIIDSVCDENGVKFDIAPFQALVKNDAFQTRLYDTFAEKMQKKWIEASYDF